MQADPAALFVSDSGTGDPAVVFVHGFGADHRVWDAAAAPLLPTTRVLACDLPGHGLSLDAEGAGSAKSAARALLAYLSRCGIDGAHVVGHSMGGAVAALMALAEPGRVASLTLLAPGGFGPEINGPLLRRYAEAADRHELRACLQAMSGESAVVPDDQLDAGLAMRVRPGQIEKLVEIAAAITRGERQGVIPAEALATLAMPATVLWGTADPVLPFAQSDGLPARFHRQVIEGAGHMLVGEAPDAVRQAIMANLAAA
ncbi:MAG: alpha/beta fold hydrolase [Mesorhizobium sp.]